LAHQPRALGERWERDDRQLGVDSGLAGIGIRFHPGANPWIFDASLRIQTSPSFTKGPRGWWAQVKASLSSKTAQGAGVRTGTQTKKTLMHRGNFHPGRTDAKVQQAPRRLKSAGGCGLGQKKNGPQAQFAQRGRPRAGETAGFSMICSQNSNRRDVPPNKKKLAMVRQHWTIRDSSPGQLGTFFQQKKKNFFPKKKNGERLGETGFLTAAQVRTIQPGKTTGAG